jgi:cyclopropane fatty-acyl-phospholipid synthase-like methyltransferase
MKPYSAACDQNGNAILDVIKPLLSNKKNVLEIGSGTGQHAVFFAKKMPHLIWQTSDQIENHLGIQQWLDEANLDNTLEPIALDVSNDVWPNKTVDAIFSANAVHIMAWENVLDLFKQAGKLLKKEAFFLLYGPFNYKGEYTSESNQRFDVWLKNRDTKSGIRDFEALDQLAKEANLLLVRDFEMPANNRILQWVKI